MKTTEGPTCDASEAVWGGRGDGRPPRGDGQLQQRRRWREHDHARPGAGGQTTPSFSGEGSEEFCALVTDLQKDESLGDLTSQNGYDDFVNALGKLDGAAPDEIHDDVHTIVQWSKKAADVYKANDFDDAKAQGSAEYAALLNDSSIEQATKNLDAYSAKVCGLTGS